MSQNGCNKCIASFDDPILNRLKNTYKYNAKARNLLWELTDKQFYNLVTKECHYCGERSKQYNGIDRIDPSKGYTINNCVSCCSWCNTMKLDYSIEDFIHHITAIYNHIKKQGSTTIENTSRDGSE